MADDNFDSSDIEVEERPNKFARVGEASFTRALKNVIEDRTSSKIAYKQRRIIYGSPKTMVAQSLWDNRFRTFLEHTLKIPTGTIPKAEHFLRFISVYPKYIVGQSPSGAIHWDTMTDGIAWAIQQTSARHPSFKLTSGEGIQIKAAMYDLLEKGILTKDRTRTALWVGSRLVLMMGQAVITEGLHNGCRNWDSVIQEVLFMSLAISTGSRSGDIARTGMFTGQEYLKWGDIAIQFAPGSAGLEGLVCDISFRYVKGQKDSSNVVSVVRLLPLSASFNVSDPIKLLIIMALRTGNVDQTSWDDLAKVTKRRQNRTIVWKDPALPVLRALKSSHAIILDTPSPASQMNNTLRKASALVGLLSVPSSHDLRRGVASETYHLNSHGSTDGEARVAKVLNHTHKAKIIGVTANYIGEVMNGRHEERLLAESATTRNRPVHAPEVYTEPVITKDMLATYMNANSLAVGDAAARRNARRAMKRNHLKSWREANDPSNFEGLDVAPGKFSPSAESVEDSPRVTQAVATHDPVPIDPRLETLTQRLMDGSSLEQLADSEELFDLTPMMPGDAAPNIQIASGVDPSSSQSSSSSSDAQYALSLQGDDFINFFSQINFQAGSVKASNGGSKDPSTPFLLLCTKGCGHKHKEAYQMRLHEATCSGQAKITVKQYPCPTGECTSMFSSTKTANAHKRNVHRWVPKSCGRQQCDQSILYPDSSSLAQHKREVHCFKPTLCPNCANGTPAAAAKVWKTLPHFKVHSLGVHELSVEQFKQLLADVLKEGADGDEQEVSES
ncbi:hypothetical protein HBI24_049340 [Parastagonospora nodorum]|nr:hypothetical protein HBH53_090880 [Parastagonospora nodorum]KAH3958883.1 hypothetical protein HBH51_205990 [Parastagonospora nodorum]KAH3974763.1 hypothetical protein HBH52_130880 [Parastagonospora nodorum]KAH4048541.1 hypothetical protein HBH49_159970 [Parastagonospora nodorum]KAH4105158.1 hypothetical protein HBH46_086040 [Parastagonospora nodorum]